MAENVCFRALMSGMSAQPGGCGRCFVGLQSLVWNPRGFRRVNGENAADGFGLSVPQMNQFFSLGVDVITSGNHIWQQEDILPYLDSESRLLRPANYPAGVKGHGIGLFTSKLGPVVVIILQEGGNCRP
jgi:calcineurin-like phosphoesterase